MFSVNSYCTPTIYVNIIPLSNQLKYKKNDGTWLHKTKSFKQQKHY